MTKAQPAVGMHGFGHDFGGKGQSISNWAKIQVISKLEISRAGLEIQWGTGSADQWGSCRNQVSAAGQRATKMGQGTRAADF
jgi:hypothetical protein